ncbi:MAG: ferric-dicitrate binding protein FerR (iron transport regulator) [Parvicellaceae bacterium]|jgi:ferric-dicitrate binding protein FerR (iron transport regulator)
MVNYDLLRKFFEDEASEQETAQIEKWRNRSVANEVKFQEIFKVWNDDSHEPAVKEKDSRSFIVRARKFIIVGLILAVAYVGSLFITMDRVYLEAKADLTTIEVELPDQSSALLFEKSTLTYPEAYTDIRKVELLKGGARFIVVNSKLDFVVQLGAHQVVVDSGECDFQVYREEDLLRIEISTGELRLKTRKLNKKMSAPFKAEFNYSSHEVVLVRD